MSDTILIVSNPPHRPGDRAAAVWCFDISPLEIVAKTAYPAPEIWFADSDHGVLTTISNVLEAVGLNTLWVRKEEHGNRAPGHSCAAGRRR